jgi:restriction system-associated AAA family ATPase
MKLLRLKITDPEGFRGLPLGFEHHFRTEWTLKEEEAAPLGFAPFVCAGRNGSGKSNLLQALAAIFFQLELQRVRRGFLPEALEGDETGSAPLAYELEYLIKPPATTGVSSGQYAHVRVIKEAQASPRMYWLNSDSFEALGKRIAGDSLCGDQERDFLLPQFVLGYSSGENEILSLPFFKMRFLNYDEYWNCLKEQLSYPGHPEARLAYLDDSFSQAILICNLLFQDDAALFSFRKDVGIEELKEFRIIIQRSIPVSADIAETFGQKHPALSTDADTGEHRLNLLHLLEKGLNSADNFDPIVTRLKRCATSWYSDEESDSLILDYWVDLATKDAFKNNFDNSPLALFQAFQVLLTLNLYSVSEELKADLYRSHSHYVSETVPTLASDQRIMRFKYVRFTKHGVAKKIMHRELSDGEYQLLHSLGLCLLFRDKDCLYLLDEPETHFNPDWRAAFITRLRRCLAGGSDAGAIEHEMLITTHTPFLISDSRPKRVLVFKKDPKNGMINVCHPDYNTFGASINKITMSTFDKRETIGGQAQEMLAGMRTRFEAGNEDQNSLVSEIHKELGDSVEKVLLIKAILDKADQGGGEARP